HDHVRREQNPRQTNPSPVQSLRPHSSRYPNLPRALPLSVWIYDASRSASYTVLHTRLSPLSLLYGSSRPLPQLRNYPFPRSEHLHFLHSLHHCRPDMHRCSASQKVHYHEDNNNFLLSPSRGAL